ncbi:P-loop NTPase [Methanobacterium ferruginis]|uniref:ATP-binding protein n=1 Tax=Methanobacterium ferruginis TaxID=710191 RepID=UPI0025723EB8|nr:P-loop NTPase [Methanobacterium ferruginis]BDZ68068.1 ATP-binding protein [Methanobacterium ferruginis]
MKLVICGKGGSGKSTIAALLAKATVKTGNSVLVIDTDESNFGLHRQLGVELPQDFMNYLGGKDVALEKIMAAAPDYESVSFFDKEWQIADIPSEYYSEKNGIKLIAIGKIHEVGEGCACTMGMVAKEFIGNLNLNSNEVVLVDTEAGIEHFGRAVEKDVDAIIMVIDPSYESMKLSEKVLELSSSIEKPVYYVLNKVDAANEQFMMESISNQDMIIAAIPANTALSVAGLKGNEIMADGSGIENMNQFLMENLRK